MQHMFLIWSRFIYVCMLSLLLNASSRHVDVK